MIPMKWLNWLRASWELGHFINHSPKLVAYQNNSEFDLISSRLECELETFILFLTRWCKPSETWIQNINQNCIRDYETLKT